MLIVIYKVTTVSTRNVSFSEWLFVTLKLIKKKKSFEWRSRFLSRVELQSAARSFSRSVVITMAFDEVAVYFSEDEWDTLNDEQKALYKEVMLENYCALLALGLVHVKPTVISKIEKAEEPFVSSGQEETPAKPCKLPFDIASRRQALVEVQQPSGHGVTQPKTQVPSVFVPRRLSLSRGHQQKGHVVVQARTRVPRVFFPRTGLDGLTNRDIIQRFRLNREAILSVYQQVSGFLEPLTARSHSIPGMVKLLAILNFLATGCFQSVVGISQPSFSRHLRVVLNALLSLLPNYVCLPETNAEWHKVKEGFHKIAKMPNVLGAIDCIHVALRPPLLQQEQYRNSKQFHSLNVQVVCDADLRVLSVRSGFPGSCDKSYILLQSALFEKFEQGLMPDGWLLGDAEYERRPWLLSPLLNPSTPTQHEFNSTHENTHSAIKRTFDALKRRFQCLDRSVGVLQYSPRTVSDIFLVCCILHNLALQYNVPVSDNDVELQEQAEEMVPMDTSEGELEGKSDIITTHLQCSPFEPAQEPATVSDAQGVDYCSSASLLNDSEHNSSDTEQEYTVTTSETTHAQGNAHKVIRTQGISLLPIWTTS
ncbi:putative nuclease HARBI1 isoform X2 [Bombina bombina]|uniref:putative nuclease HARBI1 isoform X2 n=1 Tax=Bombina bombina TaxID=8345 RepID=UPI00235AE73B|nr:putative nuclease HARBI1 isoform X2 [Bombina bombina]